ncbi:T9SS type A sorting domain-containing protein [Polaribacter sp. Hel1_85]|uniref:T9SS type A sorting domain-containing protein n=1 Tax=Polaribacter sp. Hel1_85 TaxID=1250005 RepID=UPI0005688500|nr:T9SS type A sorting domain-containing protein [Polaribacter sp. Hel1_85]
MKKTAFLLFAFIGLSSFQLNAQTDGTFNATTDALWTLDTNWSSNTIASGTGTVLQLATLDLNGNQSIGSIQTNNPAPSVSISGGTLTLVGATTTAFDHQIIRNRITNDTWTIDCNIDVNVDGKDIHNRNRDNSYLVFATGNTFNLNANTINIDNSLGAGSNPVEFNGVIAGSGTINLTKGYVTLGADSTSPAYTGGITFGGLDGLLTISSTSNIISSIGVLPASDGNSEIMFNTNQTALTTLTVDTQNLTMDFHDDVTAVEFTGIGTMTGAVNLQSYESGVLKIGSSGTVSQTILDTWLINGVEPDNGAITQDVSGYINIPTYTTTANGTWEAGATWVGGVAPSAATDNIIINHNITINSDIVVNDFSIINMGGNTERVTVEAGYSLTVNGDAITKHQLIANSTDASFASLIMSTTGSTSQNIGYNRYINSNANGNDLIAPPILESFATIQGNFYANPSDATQILFGPFDNTTGAFTNWDTDDSNGNLVVGKGYRAATDAGSTVQFKDAITSPVADVTVSITDGGDPATYGQWNLIGNPYPSYLDFDTFFTNNTGQFEAGTNNAVYGWNGGGYTIWNAATSLSSPGNKIAPGQGFFVKTIESTEGTVTFTPAMRVTGNSEDFVGFSKSASNVNNALAKINLSSATKTFATDIYFIDNQTKGIDSGYDAGAFDESKDGIYTNLVEDNTGVALSIQALPYEDFNDVVVPVSINGEAGAELTISLDKVSLTIPSNTYVYLKDNVLNTTTLLNDTDYVFTPDTALSGAGRFFIEFSAKAVLSTDEFAVNELLIYTNQESKSIIIKGVLKTAATAKVFDIQGREVLEQKLDNSSISNVVNANALKTGIYMVQLEDKVQKVIIK